MPANPTVPKVLLIGWELADWKVLHPMVDGGYLPNLERLIDRGVIADLSAASWRGLATGVPDDAPPAPPVWLAFAGQWRRCLVVRWPGSHPPMVFPAGGVYVSDEFNRPLPADSPAVRTVEPANWQPKLEALRVAASALTNNDVRAFVPALERLGPDDQAPMNWLVQALADAATTQNVLAHLLETQPWDFALAHFGALGAIGRQFMGLSQVPNGVYAGVPAAAMILADQWLGRLLELAGEGVLTCVCSAYGLFGNAAAVLAGPGIRQDERLAEKDALPASALDLAPTLCALAGVPPGEDLPGRVWDVRLEAVPSSAP